MKAALLPVFLLLWAGCSPGDPVVALLIQARNSDECVREYAVWGLAESSDPRAVAALAAALGDGSVKVRRSAAMASDRSDPSTPELVAALCRATRDPDAEVRIWAVTALGTLADPASLAAVHRASKDPDPKVRDDAVRAILRVNAALEARHVRYYPPTRTPPDLKLEDRALFLKAYEESWWFAVSQAEERRMTAPQFSLALGTICEAPPIETTAGDQAQYDANDFLRALHRRIQREPQALEEFRALRQEAVRRYPPPKDE
jgi:hypothetical protein